MCKHLNCLVSIESVCRDEYLVEDGKMVDRGHTDASPTNEFYAECQDCGRKKYFGSKARKFPLWVQRAMDVIDADID